MDSIWIYALTVFTGFLAIMNPLANTPIYIGLVQGASKAEKLRIAQTSTLTAFLIVSSFIIFGNYIFQFFGLTIPAFKLAGGVLIFFVGFEMLQSKKSTIHNQEPMEFDESVAVSPLAIPILAGPGTIVTAMNYTINANYIHIGIIILMLAFILLVTYLSFVYSTKLIQLIGQGNIIVVGKLMGIILTVIGMGMIIGGIKLAFNLG